MPTLSIDVTAPQAQRIATAFGRVRMLGRDATPAEVRAFLIDQLKSVVATGEKLLAEDNQQSAPLDIP